ncbi:MAG TPA: hypothetical protein VF430_04285 [Verrucomicrobiae bacterium]
MRDAFTSGMNQPGRCGPGIFGGAAGLFPGTLLHEVIPMIDSTCRIIPDREHRALAGLSMGGMENRNYHISRDTAHEWQAWRRIFYEFAPLLFKN